MCNFHSSLNILWAVNAQKHQIMNYHMFSTSEPKALEIFLLSTFWPGLLCTNWLWMTGNVISAKALAVDRSTLSFLLFSKGSRKKGEHFVLLSVHNQILHSVYQIDLTFWEILKCPSREWAETRETFMLGVDTSRLYVMPYSQQSETLLEFILTKC